jgi:hypothetical protein
MVQVNVHLFGNDNRHHRLKIFEIKIKTILGHNGPFKEMD